VIPTVRLVGTQIVVDWPGPPPASFSIDSAFFAALVNELNQHRAAVANGHDDVLRGLTRDAVTPAV
jgi:hypothetical protein